MPRSLPSIRFSDPQDSDIAKFQVLPVQVVFSLIFGLLSPVAMIDPTLWIVPFLGAVFSVWALRRIKRNAPAMTGRKMARFCLVVSLLLLSMAPTSWFVYRHMVYGEAQQFAETWLRYLVDNQPHKGCQLTSIPIPYRRPLDDQLWNAYRDSPELKHSLEGFVSIPIIRTLLALGPRAQVRFYQIDKYAHTSDVDNVVLTYAITYDDSGERKSFFVTLLLIRTNGAGKATWEVADTQGGSRPEGW